MFLITAGLHAEGLAKSRTRFYYRNSSGQVASARILRHYYVPAIHPNATIDPRIVPGLRRAATIADERANVRTKGRCWQYVKQALLAAGVLSRYPTTRNACDAGTELVRDFGFKRLPIHDPYAAPVGAIIVYGRSVNGVGHVELRTRTGFASDYRSKRKCYYPLLAVYGKFSA